MEEIEVPLEQSQEHIHETAHHSRETWVGRVALFSAIVAVFAAISALMAGHNSNEAMISQIKASDAWNYYQAKGVKAMVLNSKIQLLSELRKESPDQKADAAKEETKLEKYKQEQEEISKQAHELEVESEHYMSVHEILAKSVTMFQIAIAISAVSVLTRRRRIFFVSIFFALIGVGFFAQGLIAGTHHPEAPSHSGESATASQPASGNAQATVAH
jgi:uncharacterized membrane protein